VTLASSVAPVIERRGDFGTRERFAATCGEIRILMERTSPGMPAPQLERLVAEMARVQLRFEPLGESLADRYFVPHRRG